MECFDAVGEMRAFYRTTETGNRLDSTRYRDGSRKLLVRYLQGIDVDSRGEMANGKKFSGPKEFKQVVLQQPELVARNLAAKLLAYSTGQATEPGDILVLDTMIQRLKGKNYGLRSLIHEVVQCELFLKK